MVKKLNLPITIKKTQRTQLICLGNKLVKVKKTRKSVNIQGQNQNGQKWGELSKTIKRWTWTCEELGLSGLERLQMERALLEQMGNEFVFFSESLEEWKL